MPAPRSFVGGMNVPASGGLRFNATRPLAVLEIGPDGVTLRSRFVPRASALRYRVPFENLTVAYPLAGRVLTSGVGLDTRSGGTAMFWTGRDRDAVLMALAARGVPVDPRPRSAWGLSRQGEPVPAVLEQPPPPRWLVLSAPVGIVAGTALLVLLEARPGPALWHLWVALAWVWSTFMAVRILLRGRRPR